MPHAFEELTRLPEHALAALWRAGEAPARDVIAGHVFRGRNTARPARLGPGGGAFAKGFMATDDAFDGCNFPVAVNDRDWRVDVARPFGFFRVESAREAPRGRGPRSGLLLDYGRGRAARFRERGAPAPGLPLRLVELLARPLRDVLVQPPGTADGVLVGRAFFTGALGLPITYFVLERMQALDAQWAGGALPRPRRRTS